MSSSVSILTQMRVHFMTSRSMYMKEGIKNFEFFFIVCDLQESSVTLRADKMIFRKAASASIR